MPFHPWQWSRQPPHLCPPNDQMASRLDHAASPYHLSHGVFWISSLPRFRRRPPAGVRRLTSQPISLPLPSLAPDPPSLAANATPAILFEMSPAQCAVKRIRLQFRHKDQSLVLTDDIAPVDLSYSPPRCTDVALTFGEGIPAGATANCSSHCSLSNHILPQI
jgi:hypothetical protein